MSNESRRETAARIRSVLEREGDTVNESVTHHNAEHYQAIEDFEAYEKFRTAARQIKEDAIAEIPSLIEEVTQTVESNGGSVFVASDPREANEYVSTILDAQDGETVVKSKSMTTEEIGLREHLESDGSDVYETDLGEFVIQLAEESPSHIVGPALHKSREEITDLFNQQFEPETPLETPEELTAFAREYLGDRMREATLGITGANFVVAETGTISLVTNEGNARKSAVVPDTHVAVAGVEKLVPSMRDLHPFLELIARSATGQDISQYVSLLTPPVDTPTVDFETSDSPLNATEEERDFHLVLVDNGRMEMREDPQLRETLYCIRCGACLNSCANFQHVGGHAFGGDPYSGGIGTGWVAGLDGPEATADFNDLCTSCSRCTENCPVKIDIPWINTVVRNRRNRGHTPDAVDHLIGPLSPDKEPTGLSRQKRFFGHIETILELGATVPRLMNMALSLPGVDRLLEIAVGLDHRRDFPELASETFLDWWDRRGGATISDSDNRVALYTDLYTNYLYPERGRAAVRVLESLGYDVQVSAVRGSGRAPLSQGMIRTAEQKARTVATELEPALESDIPVLVIEPSDIALFQDEYEQLLPRQQAERVASGTEPILEFLAPRLAANVEASAVEADEAVFHANCQARSADLAEPTITALETLGYDLSMTDVECCGMAGSFGYKSQFYELSVDVGTDLAAQLSASGQAERTASGTSCVAQISSFDGESKPVHPIELIDRDWNR